MTAGRSTQAGGSRSGGGSMGVRFSRARGQGAGRPAPHPASQRGSASLIGLAMCAFVVAATLVTADIGAMAFARARAQTAADLAALAAVTPYPSGPLESTGDDSGGILGGLGSPAGRASAVAASNGADVLACSCGPLETIISVGVRTRLIPFGATVQVRAYARAVLPPLTAPPPGPARASTTVVRDFRQRSARRRLPEATPGQGGAVDR